MNRHNTVLIVEDQFIEANNLQMILERAGYRVNGIARSVPLALQMLDTETPDIVLLDIFLKGSETGIDLAHILNDRDIAFVYLSANSNRETLEAAKATRPYGFLVKPFREKDVLVMLEIAWYLQYHQHSIVKQETKRRQHSTLQPVEQVLAGMVGKSPEWLSVLSTVELVAPVDMTVLVLGESGTGKERVADCIHAMSARKDGPLIKVNCAALPATLIESILFGHEQGAFTGATGKSIGKFEQAAGGTLFLDEIAELPLDVQSKLLRALQEREIERLGSAKVIKVDIRIIAATNRNLITEVSEGRFRMDLYYRLNVFPVMLPALRERREDIPLLAGRFVETYARKMGKGVLHIAPSVMDALRAHDWPGNVRELEHTMERAVLLTRGETIKDITLPASTRTNEAPEVRMKTMEENERDHIIEALKRCNGKVIGKGGAADALGMNPSTLNSRIRKLGINKSWKIS